MIYTASIGFTIQDPTNPNRWLNISGQIEVDTDNTDPFVELEAGSHIEANVVVEYATTCYRK